MHTHRAIKIINAIFLWQISHYILVMHINCHVQLENSIKFLDFRMYMVNMENFLTNHLVKEF